MRVLFASVCVSTHLHPQDNSLWCSWRSKRIGHEPVTWCLHHRRLPAEKGRAALHPGGAAGRGRMSQCKCFPVVFSCSHPVKDLQDHTRAYSLQFVERKEKVLHTLALRPSSRL